MPAFGHYSVDVADKIKDILDEYPAGAATLREILQNTDDAGGTIQRFILDTRDDPISGNLVDDALRQCNGPALLAINDSILSERDWKAITHISKSSKKEDERSTGKYGQGFCTVYHVTDNPHVLSGKKLLILDPNEFVSASTGLIWPSSNGTSQEYDRQKYPGHLKGFDCVPGIGDDDYRGTAIRLPLRLSNSNSRIKSTPTSTQDIDGMFDNFMTKDLPEVMLFLKNIETIELSKLSSNNVLTTLAIARIENIDKIKAQRSKDRGQQRGVDRYDLSIRVERKQDSTVTTSKWVITHFSDTFTDVANTISKSLGQDLGITNKAMKEDKLFPHVALAFPDLDPALPRPTDFRGRLFTLLPLPIITRFPLHTHAILALTSSRQNLRNAQESVTDPKARLRVEWNRIVFSDLVPKAWAALLEHLVDKRPEFDIFNAWPDAASSRDGDQGYWYDLPSRLVEETARRAVWPTQLEEPRYRELLRVFVASRDDQSAPMTDLTTYKIPLVSAPSMVVQLIQTSRFASRTLSPKAVEGFIRENKRIISSVHNRDTTKNICDYLASADDISLILDLPIISTVTGSLTSFSTGTTSIMADPAETSLFRAIKHRSTWIALDSLSAATQQLLLKQSAARRIGPRDVISYLRELLGDSDGSSGSQVTKVVNEATFQWCLELWTWLGEWSGCEELVRDETARNLYALPLRTTRRNLLRLVEAAAIRETESDTEVRDALTALDLPILHDSLSDIPGISKITRPPSDVFFILKNIPRSKSFDNDDLDHETRKTLHDFFTFHLSNLFESRDRRRQRVRLYPNQKEALRSMPIFPVLVEGERSEDSVSFDIATSEVHFVDESVRVIPTITAKSFIDYVQGRILHTALKEAPVSSEISVLEMTIEPDAWVQQSHDLLPLIIDRLIRRLPDFQESTRQRIAELDIVDVGAQHSRRPPNQVVDPSSPLADLFDPDDEVLPVGEFAHEGPGSYLQTLRAYAMFQNSISGETLDGIVSKIIDRRSKLSQEGRTRKALRLLTLLDKQTDSFFDELPPRTVTSLRLRAWLPVTGQLRRPSECWDAKETDALLCDRVLAIVSIVIMSPHLRVLLGWQSVPNGILRRQLLNVLDGKGGSPDGIQGRVRAVLEALAYRLQSETLTPDELDDLVARLREGGFDWVPVTGGRLARAERCTLEPVDLGAQFHLVSTSLLKLDGMENLLTRMGVLPRPSLKQLRETLREISSELSRDELDAPSKESLIRVSIAIAEEMWYRREQPDFDHESLLVPTDTGLLAEATTIIVNDMGLESHRPPEGMHFAHPLLSIATARRFGIQTFRETQFHKLVDAEGPDFYIEEHITTRIAGVITEYDIEYSINEWTANAHDAGASCLNLLVDEASFTGLQSVPTKLDFPLGPALVVHNDSVFTEEDFKGIGRIGIGGKSDMSDAIGRFGLGALTFYHFTETIFRFPLRTSTQAETSKLSKRHFTSVDLFNIVKRFYTPACRSLFFTSLGKISAKRRGQDHILSDIWSVTKMKDSESGDDITGDRFSAALMKLVCSDSDEKTDAQPQQWLVTQSTTSHESFPEEYHHSQFMEKHRLSSRNVHMGLAFNFSSNVTIRRSGLFASVPLPVSTSLPVHLHASWIPAQDRRTIRNDASVPGSDLPLDSKYNQFIMQELIPPLYLESLAFINEHHPLHASKFWPRRLAKEESGIVATSLYRQLAATDYRVLRTWDDVPLSPKAALVHMHRHPKAIQKLFVALEVPGYVPEPSFDTSFLDEWPALRRDNASEVAVILRRHAGTVLSMCNRPDPTLTPEDVGSILKHLLDEGESIIGIPLLPLGNGKLIRFQESNHPFVFASHTNNISYFFGSKNVVNSKIPEDVVQQLVELKVNVCRLSAGALRELLQTNQEWPIVPGARVDITAEELKWHREFLQWITSRSLAALLEDLADLPLFPTIDGGQVISLNYARDGTVWCRAPSEDHRILPVFLQLGITVVDVQSLPSSQRSLRKADLLGVLEALARSGCNLSRIHDNVRVNDWLEFAAMIRSWLQPGSLSGFQGGSKALVTLHKLPLFSGYLGGTCIPHTTASRLLMLPAPVQPASIAKYLPSHITFAPFSTELATVFQRCDRSRIMSFGDLFGKINLQHRQLPESEDESLRALLGLFRQYYPGICQQPLIPDGNRNLQYPSQLYDHRTELFSTCFQGRAELFVHPAFRDSIDSFIRFGVKHEVRPDTMIKCIEAVDESTRGGEDTRLRAAWLWDYINQNPSAMHEIDYSRIQRLRFIPRHAQRHPLDGSLDQYASALPTVNSPDNMCLEKYSLMLWTQRASFASPPRPVVVAIYPELAAPTVDHVVDHLLVLATTVASDRPASCVFFSEVNEVYKWLHENLNYAHHRLQQLSTASIWLNIDSLEDTWVWRPATQLVFDALRDGNDSYKAKQFLQYYREVVLTAGATQVSFPELPPSNETPVHHPNRVIMGCMMLRSNGDLCDIRFEAEGEEVLAHKVILASVIPHFATAFAGGFAEGVVAGGAANLPTYSLPEGTMLYSVKSIVAYAYTGQFKFEPPETHDGATAGLQRLLDLIRLCDFWIIDELKSKAVRAIAEFQLVNQDNWNDVHEQAINWQAEELVQYCEGASVMNGWV
ncbi:hypothetical protein FRC00_011481 [Tulasnella sp. 408]|nr:hypothetical protein FRC00_011481 [Tulasnella sp. 408]